MRTIGILLILILAGFGFYRWSNSETNSEMTRYRIVGTPLSFEYRSKGPDSYIVSEQNLTNPQVANPEHIKTVVVMDTDDYDSLTRGERAGGEGPPTFTLQIYRNTENLTPQAWVERNPQLSNLPLKIGETQELEVSDAPAIAYDADGLYPNRNLVFTHGELLYYLNGSYLERESALYRDFTPLVESIEFEN